MELKELEKIDNITNEIMDKLRDIVDRIDRYTTIPLEDYINNNTYEDMGDLDDEIYSIIHNELRNNIK
tara:strand:+ start:143 stop:346 length:204 start_codon:yes stop_codon:yes gene_type:complete